LEQLASPDRIDLAPRLIRPAGWIALASLALAIIAGLVGTALTEVPTQIMGVGMLLPQAAPATLIAPTSGILVQYGAQQGDFVVAGQRLAQIGGDTIISAPYDAAVLSLPREAGRPIQAGDVLAGLLPTAGPLDAVLFMRPADAQLLRPGMPASISVESGVLTRLRGHVTTIAARPSSTTAIVRRLGNTVLGETLAEGGATVEVRLTLDDAPPPGIAMLLGRAAITTGSRNMLEMLLPGLAPRGPR
jgi:multidrug efflux pump subunit AcrA (membrane-fusion protein)